jgi:hypothetical protein
VTTTTGDALSPPVRAPMSNPARLGRLVAVAVGVAAFLMIPWTVFLGYTLPRRYDAKHWSLLWIGFDVILCAVLIAFAWLTWKRRQLMLMTAIIAGTLLFCDAWFDVITSWGNRDHWVTVFTALFAELPLAAFMFWLAYRAIRRSLAAYYALLGRSDQAPSLLHATGLYALADPEPAAEALTPAEPCEPTGRIGQARASLRSVTSELHGALDSLSYVSNDSPLDRSGIERARRAIEHALAEIESK